MSSKNPNFIIVRTKTKTQIKNKFIYFQYYRKNVDWHIQFWTENITVKNVSIFLRYIFTTEKPTRERSRSHDDVPKWPLKMNQICTVHSVHSAVSVAVQQLIILWGRLLCVKAEVQRSAQEASRHWKCRILLQNFHRSRIELQWKAPRNCSSLRTNYRASMYHPNKPLLARMKMLPETCRRSFDSLLWNRMHKKASNR